MNTQFTVPRESLARELGILAGSVERKTTIPILANIRILADGDRVTMEATDLEIAARTGCAASVKGVGAFTIPARRLLDYVRALPDGDVFMSVGANGWVSITAGASKSRIAGMSSDAWPKLPVMPEGGATTPAVSFARLVRQTVYAISSEESRFTLNGALVERVDDILRMVTTDGHRLALSEAPAEGETFKALVPKKALVECGKLAGAAPMGATVRMVADASCFYFECGGRVISSRLLNGNFPDYRRVMPSGHANNITVGREMLTDALSRVLGFSDERSRSVTMTITADDFIVAASSSETGDSEESVPVDGASEPLAMGINGAYLIDFLKSVDADTVRIEYTDATTALILSPIGSPLVCRAVIMPMRIA